MSRLPESVAATVADVSGAPVREVHALGGGCINEAARVHAGDGVYFVKWHRGAPAGFFGAEADGLARLRETATVQVPAVYRVDDAGAVSALVMEYHAPGRATAASMAEAGRALAALHRVRGAGPGLERDNFIGSLPQRNRARDGERWVAYFRRARLLALAPGLPSATRRRLEGLDLERLITEPEGGCALLHGDLWAGNLHVTAAGRAVFIDPAVYRGHPEVDLAMARLFGGFSDAFWAAYQEVSGPFDAELGARLDVLNLYPLLVHVHLFGGSYLQQVEATLRRYGG